MKKIKKHWLTIVAIVQYYFVESKKKVDIFMLFFLIVYFHQKKKKNIFILMTMVVPFFFHFFPSVYGMQKIKYDKGQFFLESTRFSSFSNSGLIYWSINFINNKQPKINNNVYMLQNPTEERVWFWNFKCEKKIFKKTNYVSKKNTHTEWHCDIIIIIIIIIIKSYSTNIDYIS